VPRPDYIAALHAAKYDLRFAAGADKARLWAAYQAALEHASRQSGISSGLLEVAVARDFAKWVRDEGLPKPPSAFGPGTKE